MRKLPPVHTPTKKHTQPLVPAPSEKYVKENEYEGDKPPEFGTEEEGESENKDYVSALVFSVLTGIIGGDRFYLEKTTTAILKLLTLGGLGIWAIWDLIAIGMGIAKDNNGKPLKGYKTSAHIAIPIVLFIAAIYVVAWLSFFLPLLSNQP